MSWKIVNIGQNLPENEYLDIVAFSKLFTLQCGHSVVEKYTIFNLIWFQVKNKEFF